MAWSPCAQPAAWPRRSSSSVFEPGRCRQKQQESVIASDSPSEPSSELRRSVALKLTVTARQLRRHFDHAVAVLGVTRSQWTMISAVARVPGATQRTLAQLLEMSEASAGRLVDRLCADGLLLRKAKDEDRRAHCVFLTPAGEALTADLAKIATAHEIMAFARLGGEDLGRLEGILERILGNLGQASRAALDEADQAHPHGKKQPPT